MKLAPLPSPRGAPSGFVLLAVLVFIVLMSMVTISLLFSSRAEETATAASAGAEQAWSAAMSGVDEALRVAATTPAGSLEWQDQPAVFRQRLVYEDGSDQWFFTVYSAADSESTAEVRHGLTDEASRVNLNRPGAADLANIPRMTPTLAQAVQRFVGSSTVSSPVLPRLIPDEGGPAADSLLDPVTDPGAGVSVRDALSAHGPLASIGELLQVPGFSWSLLYGEDANLNGRLDPNENDGDQQFPPDNQDSHLDRGMAQYFTVRSSETPLTRDGQKRINLNQPGAALAGLDLPPAFTNYLAALQVAKVTLTHPAEVLEAHVKVKNEQGQEADVPSGITKEELPRVLDLFTTETAPRREGLINLNTANAFVLATLPGVDLSLAESMVSARSSLSPERRSTIAWLFQDGVVDAAQFKRLAPQLTTRSFQFQFRVVGYGVPSGRYRVLEAEIDVAGGQRRVTGLRDITKLGIPFRLIGDELPTTAMAGISPPPR